MTDVIQQYRGFLVAFKLTTGVEPDYVDISPADMHVFRLHFQVHLAGRPARGRTSNGNALYDSESGMSFFKEPSLAPGIIRVSGHDGHTGDFHTREYQLNH